MNKLTFTNPGRILISILLLYLLSHCTHTDSPQDEINDVLPASAMAEQILPVPTPTVNIGKETTYDRFERTSVAERVNDKISTGTPLIVHAMVPLCDNAHQGIVPVPERLGNGLDLRNNLYWGARYGIKSHFKNLREWQQISSVKYQDSSVLERVIFHRRYANGANVYLVADAYRGDRMRHCVYDFLGAAAGAIKVEVAMEDEQLGLYGNADLLLFNGHNGILDFVPGTIYNKDQRIRDVAVIGCVSYPYFEPYLLRARGYPFLTASNLMAPEAYVAAAAIDAWVDQQPDSEVRAAAGRAYHKYQQCGIRGATNLFYAGWQDIERYGN